MPLLIARAHFARSLHRNLGLNQRANLHSFPVTPFRRTIVNRPHIILASRNASFTAVPKAAFRALRASAIAGGVGAGALAYANHKVEGFKQAATEQFDAIKGWGSSALDSTSNVLGQTRDDLGARMSGISSWTANQAAGLSAWFKTSPKADEGSEYYEEYEEQPQSNPQGSKVPPAVLALATASSTLLPETEDPSNDLMLLTRKLIEIRSILLSIDHGEALQLPSIVVIGSQSSGKSSVLEAIVGHEFLPKGNNMVTRRPIELTLIHTPRTTSDPKPREYAEFPAEGSGQITDFAVVQQKLTDLNLAVPATEAVSSIPIELKIHSPNVPDLSLVDLPGYVQISSMDQPEELKDKIANLCEKYIRANNVILAVCAADVDLANSPALRASRKVDPLGMRTVGVITKMDLVSPAHGAAVLANDRYPLALGYVGVVCKAVAEKEFAAHNENALVRLVKGSPSPNNADLLGPVARQEAAFFGGENGTFFQKPGVQTGTQTLKRRLMEVLEESMSSSLTTISDAVTNELEEASYQFKVHYNDRSISAESYVAETMDYLKARIFELQSIFKKPQARSMLRQEIDMAALDTLASMYWADPRLAELTRLANDPKAAPSADDLEPYWKHKLEASTAALTKSGIGRLSTSLLAQQIRDRVTAIVSQEPFLHHPQATQRLIALTDAILHDRFALTAEQVENSVKPLKREVEIEPTQWEEGRQYSIKLVEEDLRQCESSLKRIQDAVGSRKLKNALDYVQDVEAREKKRRDRRMAALGDPTAKLEVEDENDPNRPVYNPNLLVKAREAAFLQDRAALLKQRANVLKNRRCKTSVDNGAFCPEAFLSAVSAQLTYTAVQHINTELVGEFFYQFPRQIDSRYHLSQDEIIRFARENPAICRHLDLQERKEKLELVREKLDSLISLSSEKVGGRRTERRGLFGLF